MSYRRSFCQYPGCSNLAVTEVGLVNNPSQQSNKELQYWRAVCPKHRKALDKVLTITWKDIRWQERKRVAVSGNSYPKSNLEDITKVHPLEQGYRDRHKFSGRIHGKRI